MIEFPAGLAAAVPDADDTTARVDALDPRRSFIVEAPAGSGKTGLLIHRFLRLLAVVDEPEAVLALTFTRKAAAEMLQRVTSALESARKPLPDGAGPHEVALWHSAHSVLRRDRERNWRLLDQPHRLRMRTLDSLAGEIARSVPVLSGGIGSATPVDDARPLYREAARTVLLKLGGPDKALSDALDTVLMHRDGDLAGCERLVAEMLGTREQWGRLVPLGASAFDEHTLENVVRPRLNAALEQVLCTELQRLRERFPAHLLHEVASLASMLAEADGYKGEPNPLRPCAETPHAPGATVTDVSHWRLLASLLLTSGGKWRANGGVTGRNLKLELQKPMQARLQAALADLRHDDKLCALLHAVQHLPPSEYPATQWKVARALFVLLHHALVELRLLFAAREVCDFTELSLAARVALQAGEAARDLSLRLDHLLVDEMQDTSSAQYEFLQLLTAQWDGHSQTVFLVGDPKQSIYLFRQARVERFVASLTDGRLGSIPLTVLRLTRNFRSGSKLVRQFNTTFRPVFAGAGNIQYTDATPARTGSAEDQLAWNIELSTGGNGPNARLTRADSRREEAERIAAYAWHWRRRDSMCGTPPRSLAVLVRNRTHAVEVMQQFEIAGVPFRAVEMESLGDRQEVLDLLAITRVLLHPADRTALLALFRAPWCGLELADLHVLAAGDQPTLRHQALRPHLRERAGHLASEARIRTLHTLDALDDVLAGRGRQALSVDVARLWQQLGGSRTVHAKQQQNVRRYLQLLEEMEAAGEAINSDTVRAALAGLYASPSNEAGAVEILTIHKAKGLEWDGVLVPGMQRAGRADTGGLLDWLELPLDSEGRAQVLLAPIAGRGDDNELLNRYIRAAKTRATEDELRRLFYVAATRARSSLQLFASPEMRKDGDPSLRPNTLLRAAWPAASSHLEQPATSAQAQLLPFPAVTATVPQVGGLALAAGEEAFNEATASILGSAAPLTRLPLHLLQAAPPPDRVMHSAQSKAGHSFRPQGTLAARALGNAVHSLFQLLATQRGTRADLPSAASWRGRIRALVRLAGLSTQQTNHVAAQAERALENTLSFADGLWLFEPHLQARNEGELLDAGTDEAAVARFRFDRSFRAGIAPRTPGRDVLWIVDYKTSTYRDADRAGETQDAFLARERRAYKPHLDNYARILLRRQPSGTPVMLALYYPLLPFLDVFAYEA